MNQLFSEISGWSGSLQRGPVLLQLLLVPAVLAVSWWLREHLPWRSRLRRRLPLFTLGTLLAISGLLMFMGLPVGLVLLSTKLVAGWHALGLLRLALQRLLPPTTLQRLDTRLIRPLYLLAVVLILLQQVSDLRDVALIPLGDGFGSPVSLGQLMQALVITYLLVVGTGPPAEVLALGILWVLIQMGFDRTAIIAVAGGLSIGFGFGVKEVFSNVVSGLWLLFEGSVRPGEVLIIDGDACEVRALGLRATTLWRDRDNAELVIPNQVFFTTTATTYTRSDRLRRSQVTVGAAYHHDPREVVALLERTALQVPGVLTSPAPRGLALGFEASEILYALRFWNDDPMSDPVICSQMRAALWQAFKSHGIEMPYPHQIQYQVEGLPRWSSQAEDPPSGVA
ncbi:MAG: mechanosensitive ion channel domain-containing protein [Synechococcaceae cyanobacterium]|nr:mechanosensitive ion channel domain-containing protein [Synechococcaceae cyanobacterium]